MSQTITEKRALFWTAMRRYGARPFTVGEIARSCGAQRQQVDAYLKALLKSGHVRPTEPGAPLRNGVAVKRYVVAKAVQVAPACHAGEWDPKLLQIREQLWTAMRMLSFFSVADLAHTASTSKVPVNIQAAQSYVNALNKAQCLNVMTAREPSKKSGGQTPAVYRLKPRFREAGPRPFVIRRTPVFEVVDPNSNRVVFSVTSDQGVAA